MNVRILFLAGLASGLLCTGSAFAQEATTTAAPAPAPAPAPAAAPAPAPAPAHAEYIEMGLGQQEWKQRINVVARKPANHDLAYIDSRDRTAWREFTTWQGIRDERPIIARKSLGFHAPYPHRPRAERVLLIGRGPLRGPAPTE